MMMLAASAAAAATSPAACNAVKLTTAGKYGLCRLKAEAKGVKQGKAPDFTTCDAAFTRAWSKAETRAGAGVCPSEGDAAAVGVFVTRHADDLATALGGGALPDHAAELAACEANAAVCEADLAAAVACGNGVVDPGEDCDFGDLGTGTCEDFGLHSGALVCGAGCVYDTTQCETWRRVFVTSTELQGDFGGLDDGDDICRARATAAGVGGDWRAWLSTSTVNARDRITDTEYRLMDGTTVVATSLADLTDGTIQHGIDKNEFGGSVLGSTNVWTGTLANGTASAGLDCQNWNNHNYDGMAGDTSATGGAWTNAINLAPCSLDYRLYCFEN
jgi:hypothetical protein